MNAASQRVNTLLDLYDKWERESEEYAEWTAEASQAFRELENIEYDYRSKGRPCGAYDDQQHLIHPGVDLDPRTAERLQAFFSCH